MKKIILNINDVTYEKLRLEAIKDAKPIEETIKERILYKSFCDEVESSYNEWLQSQINSF